MNSDFRNSKVGDWAWHIAIGWVRIIGISSNQVIVERKGSFSLDGKCHNKDVAPMLFVEPPACFNAGPKPCEFMRGQKVLVRDSVDDTWQRAYFSHKADDQYYVFEDGDEWMSNGRTTRCEHCQAWELSD